jgi:hypothetical protein
MSITIVIPYTPYKVPVGNRTVNLTANARNRRRWPDTDARDRMRSDGFYLGRKAMEFQDDSFEPEEPLFMDVVCRVKQIRKRDDDNLIRRGAAVLHGGRSAHQGQLPRVRILDQVCEAGLIH